MMLDTETDEERLARVHDEKMRSVTAYVRAHPVSCSVNAIDDAFQHTFDD